MGVQSNASKRRRVSNRQNGSIGASSVSLTIAEVDLPHSGANDSDCEEEVEPDRSEELIQQSIEADVNEPIDLTEEIPIFEIGTSVNTRSSSSINTSADPTSHIPTYINKNHVHPGPKVPDEVLRSLEHPYDWVKLF